MRRAGRFAALAAACCLLAACGAKPSTMAYVYRASPGGGDAGFGVNSGSTFGIVLDGIRAGPAIGVTVAPPGILTAPTPDGTAEGGALYRSVAQRVGTATVTFRCATACGLAGPLAVPVRVWP